MTEIRKVDDHNKPATVLSLNSVNLKQQMLSLANTTVKLAQAALRLCGAQQLREYSLQQVEQHASVGDYWIVIYDKVYDISDFIFQHPGGFENLLEYAGRDATFAFRGVGHSKQALLDMERLLIGVLPRHERLLP